MELVEFLSKLMSLWNELGNYVRVRECKCGAVEKILQIAENDKVHQFLMGLNDEAFSTVRSQILALDTLPRIDKVFNLVQQEEAHKGVMLNREGPTIHDGAAAFAVSHARLANETETNRRADTVVSMGMMLLGVSNYLAIHPGGAHEEVVVAEVEDGMAEEEAVQQAAKGVVIRRNKLICCRPALRSKETVTAHGPGATAWALLLNRCKDLESDQTLQLGP